MKLTLFPTNQITTVDGCKVRLWLAFSGRGVACHVYVARIAVAEGHDHAQFEAELKTMPPASGSGALVDALAGG